eukprot:TRINITY_DN12785_c0_g3_i1.p1 TRINITY_DN12785_c0_g3~~TRINITY_DN12785_c0_g3_i1.p1  ORF type:complete len:260 (+),score=59.66 TRINITY_DN12785_c0_g3_i1:571-1350(+)
MERGIREVKKGMRQNESELVKMESLLKDSKAESCEINLEKQLAKELEKEEVLLKRSKAEQEMIEKKRLLQAKLEQSLQSLQTELEFLEGSYKSKYGVDAPRKDASLQELKDELLQLNATLLYEQKKSTSVINNLRKEIEAAKDQYRIKSYEKTITSHKVTECTRLLVQQSKLRNYSQCQRISESPNKHLNYYNDNSSKQWRNYKLNKLSKSTLDSHKRERQYNTAASNHDSKRKNIHVEKTMVNSLNSSAVQSPLKPII